MRKKIAVSALLVLACICLPLFFAGPAALRSSPTPAPTVDASPTPDVAPQTSGSADGEIRLTVFLDGENAERTMAEYLPLSVAAEMPASFESEALKAQAVAIRTYILYRSEHRTMNHPDSDVCSDPGCCKAYVSEESLREKWGSSYDAYFGKIESAVRATDGQYLSYGGAVIQAVFHSSSPGRTEASGNIWSPLPYLVSVDSPEGQDDVPNYITTVEVAPANLRQTTLASYPEAVFGEDPAQWIGPTGYYDSGRVAYLNLGGIAIPGSEMRGMFSLRSACFTLEYTGEFFLFTVTGYGHGVGLSQYGANVMAKSGTAYADILAHYYLGTNLETPR